MTSSLGSEDEGVGDGFEGDVDLREGGREGEWEGREMLSSRLVSGTERSERREDSLVETCRRFGTI